MSATPWITDEPELDLPGRSAWAPSGVDRAAASSGSPPGWPPWARPASMPGRLPRHRSSRRARSSPRSKRFRYGGGGFAFSQVDPSSHDFNKDLYCNGVPVPLCRAHEVQRRLPGGAPRREQGHARTATGRSGPSRSARIRSGPTAAPALRATSSTPGSASSIRPRRRPYAAFLYDIKNGEAFNKGQVTDAGQVGVKAKDDWTLEVTLEGPRGYFPVLTAYLAALPGHKASIEKHGDKWTEPGNIVSNGPFVLETWDHGKQHDPQEEPALLRREGGHPREGDRSRSSRSRPASCRTRTTRSTSRSCRPPT